jgi:3-dehydroquinate synthase
MTPDAHQRVVRVNLGHEGSAAAGDRSYDVVIGAGVLGEIGPRLKAATDRAITGAMLVIDTGVPRTFVERARGSIASVCPVIGEVAITPSEKGKSLATLDVILQTMTRARLERSGVVVCIGGGIVGDVGGFAAGVYRRGIGVVQCPTTLLSMVDASVGGKTGVNLSLGTRDTDLKKNMVGVFHQPRLVVADVHTLDSLDTRTFACGVAECLKHGLLGAQCGDPGLWSWTLSAISDGMLGEDAALIELVARNIAIKARVVECDEFEDKPPAAGDIGRLALNLGHTFGHALETIPGLSPDGNPSHAPLEHGEAVALGMVAAARCAHALGLCDAGLASEIIAGLRGVGLPTGGLGAALPPAERVLDAMMDDKKVLDGSLRLILPKRARAGDPVRVVTVDEPARNTVIGAIEMLR